MLLLVGNIRQVVAYAPLNGKNINGRSVESPNPISRTATHVRDGDDPESVRLFQKNDSERESCCLPTPRAEPAGFARFGIALNFRNGGFDTGKESSSQCWIATLVKFGGFAQLTCGDPMVRDGFHLMCGGPLSSLAQQELPSPPRFQFPSHAARSRSPNPLSV